MSTPAGALEILMFSGITRLQQDMNAHQRTVGAAMKNIENMAAQAQRALGAIGIGLSAAAFASFIKGAIDAGDRMNDLRTRTGLLGQELLTLEGAAVRSGTSLDAISDVTSKFGKRLGAVEIGTGEAASAFAAMNISVTKADGSLKSVSEILRESGEKFKGYADGADKATLATAAFGKGGDKLIPVIQAIADVEERFKRLSITIEEDFLTAADKFKDTMDDIKSLNDVLARQIATALLPYLQQLADVMVTMASNTETMKTKVDAVVLPLKTMATGMLTLFEVTAAASEMIVGIGAAIDKLSAKDIGATVGSRVLSIVNPVFGLMSQMSRLKSDDAVGAVDELNIAAGKAQARLAGLSETVTKFWADAAPPKQILSDLDNWDLMGKKTAPKLANLKAIAQAAQDAVKEIEKLLALGKKGEGEAADARVKKWQDEQNAINDFRNAGFEEDAKLLALGVRGEEDAALARAEAVKGEIEAINDARNAEFEADKRRQEERLRETKRQADEIDRLLGDAILHGFERGKGFARNFWDSMIDMAKTVVLRPVISAILSPVTGAVTSTLAGMGLSGSANAGGIGNLFSAGSSLSTLFGSGVPVTNTAGALASGSGYFGAGSAAGAISTAIPYVAAAVAAYYVGKGLGLFGGSDSYATTTGYRLSGTSGAGGFTGNMFALAQNEGTQYADVVPGSTTAQWGDALKMALAPIVANITAVAGKLGLDAGALGGNFSIDATGTSGADMLASAVSQVTEQMALALIPGLKDMQQAGESLAQTFDRVTQAEIALNAQRRDLDIKLMEAQGNALGALAAKREDEMAAIDATLRPLQQLIYATEDWAASLKTASDAASSAVNTQISATQSAASAARSAADQYRNLATSLADAAGRIMGGGRGAAGGTLDAIFGTAMTGNAGALAALPQAAEDFLSASKASARNATELARDQAKAANMLTQASTVSTGAANWQDYQAGLLEAQVGALEAIQAQLSMPSPDAAVLTEQAGLLGTIAELLQAQTSQIVAGNAGQVILMQDQTGQIILANALTTDQTGQVVLGNSWLAQQAVLLATGNALTADGTGQLLAGSYAVRDGVGNLVNVTVDQAGRISQVGALIDAGIDINSAASIGEYLDAVSAAVAGNNTAEATAVRAAIGVLRQTAADGLIAATEAAPTRDALATLQASTGGLLAQSIGVDSAAALQAVERATAIVQATTGLQGAIGAQTGSLLAGSYTVTDPQTGQLVTLTVDQTGKVAAGNVTLTSINGGQWGIQSLIGGQTAQIVNGNLVLRDQAGLITSSNAILRDQSGVLTLGNALVGTQTGQIITGNATQDAIRNISALNTSYSEQQLAALVASGGVQSDSLAAIVIGNATIASLIQQFVGLQNQQARTAYNDAFTLAAQNIWASVQAGGGTLADFDAAMNVWRSEHPVPSFAIGTSYVPSTGPAMLHQGERVFTAAANDELVSEVRALRSEISSMRRDTKKTSDNIEAVANGQRSFSTVAG